MMRRGRLPPTQGRVGMTSRGGTEMIGGGEAEVGGRKEEEVGGGREFTRCSCRRRDVGGKMGSKKLV
jgi:hypothetical protein